MKQIIKNQEPEDFRQWKELANDEWQPSWTGMPGDIKRNLHQALIDEQGAICCYCGSRIEARDSHIEHFRPRGRHSFPQLEIEYSNLLASCQRGEKPGAPLHCGKLKGKWFDERHTVSPLEGGCDQRFRFGSDGRIFPHNEGDDGARQTIEHLGLDIDKLRAMRRSAIEGVIADLDNLSDQDLCRLITGFTKRDDADQFPEFCIPIVSVLRELQGAA